MPQPPVFCAEEIGPEIIEDLKAASATYCGEEYTYTCAFERLFTNPARRAILEAAIAGNESSEVLVDRLREWLLSPWHSTRSLTPPRIKAVATAMSEIQPSIHAMPSDLRLEDAAVDTLNEMAYLFRVLDRCDGVGATIASKLLAPLRPGLFPMWDNPIADVYGFALNAAGYRQYLTITQAIARKARSYWSGDVSLEEHLKPQRRSWCAPLAKILDEWNWIRITQRVKWKQS